MPESDLFHSILVIPYLLVLKKTCVYSYYDDEEAKFQIEKWKGKEVAYIDNVRLCGTFYSQEATKACIVFRIPVRFCWIVAVTFIFGFILFIV
jgi:hypothetical protein